MLHSRFQNTETVWSLNEKGIENLGINEKKGNKQEANAKGLILKELPSHLKYAFLEPEGAKTIIISAALNKNEDQQLLRILRNYKKAISWSIEDLKGIRPSICMHKILLNDDEKTSVEHQRRLNLVMKDVVRKEVLKWLNEEFIYAIADSPWVSPVHVVPMKGGITVIINEKNELIPIRIVIGWRVCID